VSSIVFVDAGGSSIRALLFDSSGVIKGRAQVPVRIISLAFGAIEHDPEELWAQFLSVIKKLLTDCKGCYFFS